MIIQTPNFCPEAQLMKKASAAAAAINNPSNGRGRSSGGSFEHVLPFGAPRTRWQVEMS